MHMWANYNPNPGGGWRSRRREPRPDHFDARAQRRRQRKPAVASRNVALDPLPIASCWHREPLRARTRVGFKVPRTSLRAGCVCDAKRFVDRAQNSLALRRVARGCNLLRKGKRQALKSFFLGFSLSGASGFRSKRSAVMISSLKTLCRCKLSGARGARCKAKASRSERRQSMQSDAARKPRGLSIPTCNYCVVPFSGQQLFKLRIPPSNRGRTVPSLVRSSESRTLVSKAIAYVKDYSNCKAAARGYGSIWIHSRCIISCACSLRPRGRRVCADVTVIECNAISRIRSKQHTSAL
jgi:hypothetical protein